MKRIWTSSILPLLFAGAVCGQEPVCDRGQSFEACYDRLMDEAERAAGPAKTAAAVVAEAEREISSKASSSIAPNTGRGLLDLLPTFASSFGIDGLKNSDGQLTFDRRFEMGQWRTSVKGTAYLNAELYEPLRLQLPESIRETRSQDLDKQIGDFDKVDYQVTITREKDTGDVRFGRDPADYDDLAAALVQGRMAAMQRDFRSWAAGAAARIRPPANQEEDEDEVSVVGILLSGQPISELIATGQISEAGAAEVEAGIRTLTAATTAGLAAIDADTDRLDELINNQPQLFFDALVEDRDALTGPTERSASFTYEMGVAGNVNKYLRWARGNVAEACRGNAFQLSCFESYLDTYPDAANAGQRVAFSLSYADTRPIHFELPADQFVFAQPGTEKLIGSLTYGRYFPGFQFFAQLLPDGMRDGASPNQGTRVDLEARYESPVEDAGVLHDRLVATLTFTQGMTENTGMSFGIVYANRPEFLGDVDDKLSANIGLRWKTGMPGQ